MRKQVIKDISMNQGGIENKRNLTSKIILMQQVIFSIISLLQPLMKFLLKAFQNNF